MADRMSKMIHHALRIRKKLGGILSNFRGKPRRLGRGCRASAA